MKNIFYYLFLSLWFSSSLFANELDEELIDKKFNQIKTSEFCTTSEWNEIQKKNPDIIIMMPCGFGIKRTREDIHYLQKKEGWQELRAVKENRVYVVDGNQYFNRPGPRLVDSAEILAEIINPDYFERKYSENAWIAINS